MKAIKLNLFEFYYQPFINIVTDTIYGAEALIRWVEPDGNVILPDDFIPLAENSGVIDQITASMISNMQLNKVCKVSNLIKPYTE